MRYLIILRILVTVLLTFYLHITAFAQEDKNTGKILNISENTAVVYFELIPIGLGDEVVFKRFKEIVDPVTNKVMGGLPIEIGRGIVWDVGLGKAYVNIISKTTDIESSDIVIYTGREKKITRPKVVGKIQQLVSDNEIEIDVGIDDEINEGDFFLINRTENVYDPETNEITETRQVEVGRGRVSSVAQSSSRAELVEINPGIEINLETDDIVFKPLYEEEITVASFADSLEVADLRYEISDLKLEMQLLRATIDSLGLEHHMHRNEFDILKSEIDQMFSNLMKSDMVGSKIMLKNDEPITPEISGNLWNLYKKALDDCLNHVLLRFGKLLRILHILLYSHRIHRVYNMKPRFHIR